MAEHLLTSDTVAVSLGEVDLSSTRDAIDVELYGFLDRKRRSLSDPIDAQLSAAIDLLEELAGAGGKRLRPLLCHCGWLAAGGVGDDAPVLKIAASLELFHMFALIHDDVMDASESRRGRPTLHRRMADDADLNTPRTTGAHRRRLRGDDADRLANNCAILVGDLALVWSDELIHSSGLASAQLRAIRPLLDAMRTELMLGQYLDVRAACDLDVDVDMALAIARHKSGRYTIERPLQIGVALAGGSEEMLRACSDFALPVGEAFQLRDDILGVFGDPAVTGKSRLEDLRDGKATALIALALKQADAAQRRTLTGRFGDPELDDAGAAEVRELLIATKAVETVEEMIRERWQRGMQALEDLPFHAAGRGALRSLAVAATQRKA
ncbi:polyprenyl synthetase family protein [Streptomyces odonnellii]|uniref:polyprenyl synthetase family protein n=1 Tax=Streptomyces odonnellii TaxID=1417980 RepID=UPI000695F6AB|nr:polyprenyl synthetase family protein [Streptomyces odonnellii]